jgi:CheY-like chemotaxis protein
MQKVFILIAEDDADDRFLLESVFKEQGFTDRIEFVPDGIELMNFLHRIHHEDSEDTSYPRFILLDLNMPKKDGREALSEIKQHPVFKRIPVIVFTTTKSEIEVRRCYELGANTYIVKPVSFDGLIRVIEEIRSYWFTTASVPG